MCMEFAGYWPVQRDPVTNEKINICAWFNNPEQNLTGTYCGDMGNITEGAIILEPNPAFEDEIGAPTDFGNALGTCPAPEPLAPETPTATLAPSPPGATTSDTDEEGEGEESVEQTADDDDDDGDDDDVCFPASATVQLADGWTKRMDELEIGDSVLVGHKQYSDVFMFTHRSAHVPYRFVQVTTSGGKTMKLTRGHFIYLDGHLRMAGSARRGDRVWVESGTEEVVVDVRMVKGKGLYNPQTIDGDIVVDGVSACSAENVVLARAHDHDDDRLARGTVIRGTTKLSPGRTGECH
ncbi:hypothetical protein FGB62_81g025 [Gracilaria domingensis]|nr:hypothetical protein FGB62_81g025 [Gracilaria domingensis]